MDVLRMRSIIFRTATGKHAGRKVATLLGTAEALLREQVFGRVGL